MRLGHLPEAFQQWMMGQFVPMHVITMYPIPVETVSDSILLHGSVLKMHVTYSP